MADSDAAKMAQIEAEIQKTLHEIDQLNAAYEKNRTDILDRPLVATKGENLVLLRKQLDRLQGRLSNALELHLASLSRVFKPCTPPTVLSLHVHVLIVVGPVSLAVFFSLQSYLSIVHPPPLYLGPFDSTVDRVVDHSLLHVDRILVVSSRILSGICLIGGSALATLAPSASRDVMPFWHLHLSPCAP
jgi:hypothetical protein